MYELNVIRWKHQELSWIRDVIQKMRHQHYQKKKDGVKRYVEYDMYFDLTSEIRAHDNKTWQWVWREKSRVRLQWITWKHCGIVWTTQSEWSRGLDDKSMLDLQNPIGVSEDRKRRLICKKANVCGHEWIRWMCRFSNLSHLGWLHTCSYLTVWRTR